MKTFRSAIAFTAGAVLVFAAAVHGPAYGQKAREAIAAAVAHSGRPAEEVADDALRRPAEVLAFAGLRPGMHVFEMEAGRGYYTAIMSQVVGDEGSVVMQNPAPFESFYGDAPVQRAARMANVRWSATNFDELDAAAGSMDLVTWILGPHELWFNPDGVSFGDPVAAFAEIARILKPGGTVLLMDHRAAADAGTEVGGTLHRIPESAIRELAQDAGLRLRAESDMFANPDDPLDISVFHESIRRYTNRFVLLFEK